MLTLYTTKGDIMHVLPLPFGMALALLPRLQLERIRRPSSWRVEALESARDRIRTEDRYAEFRQRLV